MAHLEVKLETWVKLWMGRRGWNPGKSETPVSECEFATRKAHDVDRLSIEQRSTSSEYQSRGMGSCPVPVAPCVGMGCKSTCCDTDKASSSKSTPKRTRPDRAAALSGRRFTTEKVVKSGIRKRLLQASLQEPIKVMCASISQAMHRGGLIFNDIVMRHISERRAGESPTLPFPSIFDDETSLTFFRNMLIGGTSERRVSQSLTTTFRDYPSPDRHPGDSQLYTWAAKTFQTSVRNLVTEAFGPRQIRYVKSWCAKSPARRGTWWAIIKRINGWGVQEDITLEAAAFVTVERQLLGNPSEVSTKWLKDNSATVFEAYGRWLKVLEVHDEARFHLTPHFGVKMHYITIDTDALYGIMKAAGLYGGNIKSFRNDSAEQWGSVFKTTGLATSQWTFSRTIETDGVACSIHFTRDRTQAEIAEANRRASDKAARKQATLERKATRARSPERMKQELAAKRKTAAAQKRKMKQEPPPPPPPAPVDPHWHAPCPPDGTLGEDPGVSPNVTYTVHMVNGQRKRRRFTVGRYYSEGGVKRLQARTATWLSGIQAEQDTLTDVHLKTANWETLQEHVLAFAEVHSTIWREKTKSRWARGRFDTYIRKPQAVDRFYSEVAADGPVTRHFFGNGSFRATYKGCLPAPKTLVARRSKMAFPGHSV